MRIPGRFELGVSFLSYPFDVAQGKKPVQPILIIYHQQLMNPRTVGKKLVGARNRITPQVLAIDHVQLLPGSEGLRHLALRVTLFDDVAWQ